MVIKRAAQGDIDQIIELRLMNAQYHADLISEGKLRGNTFTFLSEHTIEIIDDFKVRIFVAVENDCIIGCAIGSIGQEHPILDFGKQGLIDEVFVTKEFQSCGYGSMLVDELIKWFHENEIKRIDLNVYQLNSKGTSFWEKQGFEVLFKRMTTEI